MNEHHFTTRLQATLNDGLASVPLAAMEPASARYRRSQAAVGRRPKTRLLVAVAAVGLALLTSVAGAAASGASPTNLVSTAVHRVVVLFEGTASPEPASPPTSAPPPPATAQGQGEVDRTSQPADSPAPAPSEEPAPPPADAPSASPPEDTPSNQGTGPVESPSPTL